MTEQEAEIYRLKLKVAFLERAVFRQALLAPLLRGGSSSDAVYQSLLASIRKGRDSGYQAFGLGGDPAVTALYGDEVARVFEELEASLMSVNDEIKASLKKA